MDGVLSRGGSIFDHRRNDAPCARDFGNRNSNRAVVFDAPVNPRALGGPQHWDGFDESMRAEFRVRRWLLCSIIERIYNYLTPKFFAAHEAGFRPTHL